MPVNGIEIKEGQVWLTHGGRVVRISKNEDSEYYPYKAHHLDSIETYHTVSENGRYNERDDFPNSRNLVKLISTPLLEPDVESDMPKKYSIEEFRKAVESLHLKKDSVGKATGDALVAAHLMLMQEVFNELEREDDPEYNEYLRLKSKFE